MIGEKIFNISKEQYIIIYDFILNKLSEINVYYKNIPKCGNLYSSINIFNSEIKLSNNHFQIKYAIKNNHSTIFNVDNILKWLFFSKLYNDFNEHDINLKSDKNTLSDLVLNVFFDTEQDIKDIQDKIIFNNIINSDFNLIDESVEKINELTYINNKQNEKINDLNNNYNEFY